MKTSEELKAYTLEIIENKFKDHNISASDIHELACAQAELTRNDFLKEMWNKTSSYGMVAPIGSDQNTTYQLRNDMVEGDQ